MGMGSIIPYINSKEPGFGATANLNTSKSYTNKNLPLGEWINKLLGSADDMARFVTWFVDILLKFPRIFESDIQAQGTSSHHHWSPTDPISSSQNPTSGASPGSAGDARNPPTVGTQFSNQQLRTSNFNTAEFCCLKKCWKHLIGHTEIFWSWTWLHHLTPAFVGRISFCFFCIRHVSWAVSVCMVLGILKCDETHRLVEVVCPFDVQCRKHVWTIFGGNMGEEFLPRIRLDYQE